MAAANVIYNLKTTPALKMGDKKTYRKELIYTGDFEKPGQYKFTVDEALLHHWKNIYDMMLSDGIKIPLPAEHTEDPTKNNGYIVGLDVSLNSKKLPALFMECEFACDEKEAERLAKSTDVSIYVPNEYSVGKKTYYRPIKHVALTNYPVITGLEPFQAIAASLVGEKKTMSVSTIAEKLGVPVADKDEAELEAAVITQFTNLQRELEDTKKKLAEATGEETDEDEEVPAIAASTGLLSVLRDNREMKIDRLRDAFKITPATATALKADFCSDDQLTLALSNTSHAAKSFDATIAALDKNAPYIKPGEQTPGQRQAVALSNTKLDDSNPIIADAKRRQEEDAKKNRR